MLPRGSQWQIILSHTPHSPQERVRVRVGAVTQIIVFLIAARLRGSPAYRLPLRRHFLSGLSSALSAAPGTDGEGTQVRCVAGNVEVGAVLGVQGVREHFVQDCEFAGRVELFVVRRQSWHLSRAGLNLFGSMHNCTKQRILFFVNAFRRVRLESINTVKFELCYSQGRLL